MLHSLCMVLLWGTQPESAKLSSSIQVASVRKIIASVVQAAEENQKRPEGPRKGDELASFYVQRAIQASLKEKTTPQELLFGLGIALDHTTVVRDNPLARPILKQIESDADRKHRLSVLGNPTMKGRNDWLLHFSISAALTAILNARVAEDAGITKEVLDSKGGSGFSFADLAADYAGINFAESLLKNPKEAPDKLARWSKDFAVETWLPRMDGFEEGLSWRQVCDRFGGLDDPRFRKACRNVRDQVLKAKSP